MSIRRRIMMSANNKPYDAEIEYLEARDGSFINTGLFITKSTKVEIKHQILALYNECASDIFYFQALTSNNDATYCFRTGGNTIRTRWGSSSSTDLTGIAKNDIILFTVDGTKYINKNITKNTSKTANTGNTYSSVAFKLFHPNYARPVRIFYAKIGDLDLIPVKKDGVGYMYDKVSGQLFGNSGTGSFILGPVVSPALPSNPVPNDEIWYTSTNNRTIASETTGYGANLVSHTYADGKGIMKFDGNVTTIPEDAFSNLNGLQTIAFPDSVTAIHGKAFSNCSGLTTIQLGKGLLTMNDNYQGAGGSFTFDDCYNLSKIVSLKPVAANIDNWCFHDFRPVGSTVPCVLAIPSGATGYNNWKYTIYDDTNATADLTFYSFTTKTLEESDCLFLNT